MGETPMLRRERKQMNGLGMIDWGHMGTALGAAALFGIVGVGIVVLGFKVFDWMMPKIDVEKELCDRNIAVAIVMAAAILGVSAVMVASIMG
jgi:putative membrane protein